MSEYDKEKLAKRVETIVSVMSKVQEVIDELTVEILKVSEIVHDTKENLPNSICKECFKFKNLDVVHGGCGCHLN